MAVFLWSIALIGYYSSKRPTAPMPERSWTEPLRWTHGHYGTHAENEQGWPQGPRSGTAT
jgi:hypothetical protein